MLMKMVTMVMATGNHEDNGDDDDDDGDVVVDHDIEK